MTQTAYPIDGCGPLQGDDVAKYDGQWLLVDADFVPLDLEEHERLEQVSLTLRLGYLVLTAPGMLRLDLVPDVIEDDDSVWHEANRDRVPFMVVDEGDLAAAWFSNFLNAECRLVKRLPEGAQPAA